MNKIYTTIEQSKRLAEILPIESADMCWGICDETLKWKTFPYLMPWRDYTAKEHYLPCWSLGTLLNILPHCIDDRYDLTLGKLPDNESWYICYDDVDNFVYIYITKSNLVDACVEMIFILKEKDLI